MLAHWPERLLADMAPRFTVATGKVAPSCSPPHTPRVQIPRPAASLGAKTQKRTDAGELAEHDRVCDHAAAKPRAVDRLAPSPHANYLQRGHLCHPPPPAAPPWIGNAIPAHPVPRRPHPLCPGISHPPGRAHTGRLDIHAHTGSGVWAWAWAWVWVWVWVWVWL